MTTSRRRKAAERELRIIELHEPEYPEDSDLDSVKDYLGSFFPSTEVRVKPPVFNRHARVDLDAVAESMARSRVKDPAAAVQTYEPLYGEIDFERRAAMGKSRVGGVVYDGRRYSDLLASSFAEELALDRAVVVFTQRLLSTYSWDDLRHHLRTLVCGFPSVISIPGIVEAPAKPREYYLARQELETRGVGELQLEQLKSSFRGRFVDHGDAEMIEVSKGLALQAIMFHLTLEPFCEDVSCRLYNAHWQEDLVKSQITSGSLCDRHRKALKKLRDKPTIDW
jgi:hypothetical protein